MPFPPWPATPAPVTHVKGEHVDAAQLRSDVYNALLLLTQPPVFSGAATGVPTAFTYATSAGLFTSNATYADGQTLLLSGLTGCSAFSTTTVYFVQNSGSAPGTFQLATTGTGSPITTGTSGSGTAQMTQQIATSTWTPVNLDTGVSDAWSMHQATSNPPYAYGMFPGWYLAEFLFATNYTGGSGTVSAGITAQEGTALPVTIGGARMPSSGTSGRFPGVAAVKLLEFSNTGSYAGPGNNYAAGIAWQDSGSTVTPLATGTRYPQLNLEWVSALDSNPALPVPDNDAWPTAPDLLGRTFLNKNIRDTIGFLAAPPIMEAVYVAGSFSLGAQSSLPAVGTTIPLDTVHVDNRATATQAQMSTSTHIWTCLYPGIYDVLAQSVTNAASTSTSVAVGITVTSVNYNSGSAFTVWGPAQKAATSGVNSAIARRRLRLSYGDTLKLAGFQADSASAAATVPGSTWKPRLITIWRAA